MSTRATYRVEEFNECKSHVQYFYIHSDNYPSGAASYFKMLKSCTNFLADRDIGSPRWRFGKAITAFGMIPNSEFTRDHHAHFDTDYQYNLNFNNENRKWCLQAMKDYQEFFSGSLDSFIEKYGK